MSDADAAEFLSSYGLRESGLVRLIRNYLHPAGPDFIFYRWRRRNAAPGPFPLAPAPRRERALSTPIWRSTSFVLKPSAGISC